MSVTVPAPSRSAAPRQIAVQFAGETDYAPSSGSQSLTVGRSFAGLFERR
jgi:hypothetical protein